MLEFKTIEELKPNPKLLEITENWINKCLKLRKGW